MLLRTLWAMTVVFIVCISPTVGEQYLAGNWQSVDFVRNVENFEPGKKSCRGDLFLKEFQCSETGRTSLGWSRINGWTIHTDGKTKYRYFLKQMDSDEYLFLPWLSGDVTQRGAKPSYYVLKKVSEEAKTPNVPSQQVAGEVSPVGHWQSVDFVRKAEDFRPGVKKWRGDLFLKKLQFHADGRTSIDCMWRQGWIAHSNGRTRAQYYIKNIDGATYLFLPWLSGDVTERGAKPSYYVLKKVSGETQTPGRQVKPSTTKRQSFQTIRPITSVKEFNDVRWKDMSKLDLTGRADLPATLTFNEKTIWPSLTKMPIGCYPRKLMSEAMNPGLGIRDLHRQGITGKGVNVAIIDQPLYQDHPEFAGKVLTYHDVGCGSESSMHGPAVASLLVGSNCGTAPGARVYYVAAPSWTKDSAYQAKALDWIINQNENLPVSERIRVVSVSAAPSGPGTPFDKNQKMWDVACSRAEAKGILVLDCTQHRGFIGPCYYDSSDPENVSMCNPGFPGRLSGFSSQRVLVPCSPRTTAEEYNKGEISYQYCGRGGLSWSIPYCAGVLALGWQLRPELSSHQMRDLLFKSAHVNEGGAKIINPKEFIRMIRIMPKGTS